MVSIIPGIERAAPGAHRDQQRVAGIAEALAGLLLEPAEVLRDLALEALPDSRRHDPGKRCRLRW